jgi:hypothetical protein
MRLLVTAGLQRVWVGLEPETGEEAMALEACAARGEWTNGHGADAIVRLQALAMRLGFPITLSDAAHLDAAPLGCPPVFVHGALRGLEILVVNAPLLLSDSRIRCATS